MDYLAPLAGHRIIDLTQTFEEGIPVPPGQPQPAINPIMTIEDGGSVNAEQISIGVHTGTHVDAPYHFYSQLGASDTIAEPERLIGRGIVLDMSHKHGAQAISAEDIQAWEARVHIAIVTDDIVLVRTDHWRSWHTGSAGIAYVHGGWPYFDDSAVAYLTDCRIKAVGVEVMDPDRVDWTDGTDTPWPTHRTFLKAGILIMENLCHLDAIGVPVCMFIGLPMKIHGVSGAPLRAIALV